MVDEISRVFDQNSGNANSGKTEKGTNRRTEPRIPYSGLVFFSTKRGFFEGELTNYSKHGLFIKTQADLPVGEVITVALPYVENEEIKFQAQILRRNHEGYGLELFRERNDNNLQVRKIEAKSR
jgi:hypothetical protein